ncbi:S9 family peptidase [Desertivirga arenae]|uniref:S9 family peptidase n=1 Tax=Desertivirga arenae TaxID=2810309 RepID=UPI001A9588BB|nr:S9 family peptidase [Pedobacter sp. SYSU D00823]
MFLTKRNAFLLAFLVNQAVAQTKPAPFVPSREYLKIAFRRAEMLDSTARKSVYKTTVSANWNPDGYSFWYVNRLAGDKQEYIYVDPGRGIKREAFDAGKIAKVLSELEGKRVLQDRLNIDEMYFLEGGSNLQLKNKGKWYLIDLTDYSFVEAKLPGGERYKDSRPLQYSRPRWEDPKRDSVSADQKWVALVKDGNVFLKEKNGTEVKQLSTDGTAAIPYDALSWAPDGKTIVAWKVDERKEKEVHLLLSSVSGTTRAQLKSRPYAQPGDEFTSYEMNLFSPETRSHIKPSVEKIDFFGAPELHWRNASSRYFTYEKVDRGHQRFRVIEVDALTGKSRNIIDEQTPTFIYEQRIYTHYLPKTAEIVWISEKDGWRHIYLIDERTGKQKQQITRGNWVVRGIDSVDAKKREIWFRASGMNPDEDPYLIHYYRIGFDGKNLINLTPEKGTHLVRYSPDRKYFIDTYSLINVAPVTELKRTSDGRVIMRLETADLRDLEKLGVKAPVPFSAKGRDSKTEIYGIACFPTSFDPDKTYPVIENIYAGPQDSYVRKDYSAYSEMQSLADAGFIVVQIDGMGTANRSKAFHDVCWKNLADAGFPDRILWMKALAAKYPQADISRVGAYGTSAGGQNAAGALLFQSDFYKAAVASCGCHDNRIDKQWWNEQWMGYPVGPHYDQQSNISNAQKLRGDLMLIVGEVDENVPPESTYRFADALIKANKDFDFLMIPGMGHSDGGTYGRRRKRDFFLKHLHHVDIPNRDESKELSVSGR